MASSPATTTTTAAAAADSRDKTVIGYPAHPSLIAAGYPPPSAYPITSAAYPYLAPPPQPTSFSGTYRHSIPTHHNQQRNFLSRLLSAVIAAVFVLFVIFFVAWMVFRPRLPEFVINPATLSSFNATGTELSANWDITFSVKNPNGKLSLYYDRIEARIVYGDDYLLAGTELPNFYQNKLNETAVRARFAAAMEGVDGNVVESMSRERASGSVNFEVVVLALIRFRKGAWRTRWNMLRVSCENVRFGFSKNDGSGSLLDGPRACKVAL